MKTPGLGQGKGKAGSLSKQTASLKGKASTGHFSLLLAPSQEEAQGIQPNQTGNQSLFTVVKLQAVNTDGMPHLAQKGHAHVDENDLILPLPVLHNALQSIPDNTNGTQPVVYAGMKPAPLKLTGDQNSIRLSDTGVVGPKEHFSLDDESMEILGNFLMEAVFPLDEKMTLEVIQSGEQFLTIDSMPSTDQPDTVKMILHGLTPEQRSAFAGHLQKELSKNPLMDVSIKTVAVQPVSSLRQGKPDFKTRQAQHSVHREQINPVVLSDKGDNSFSGQSSDKAVIIDSGGRLNTNPGTSGYLQPQAEFLNQHGTPVAKTEMNTTQAIPHVRSGQAQTEPQFATVLPTAKEDSIADFVKTNSPRSQNLTASSTNKTIIDTVNNSITRQKNAPALPEKQAPSGEGYMRSAQKTLNENTVEGDNPGSVKAPIKASTNAAGNIELPRTILNSSEDIAVKIELPKTGTVSNRSIVENSYNDRNTTLNTALEQPFNFSESEQPLQAKTMELPGQSNPNVEKRSYPSNLSEKQVLLDQPSFKGSPKFKQTEVVLQQQPYLEERVMSSSQVTDKPTVLRRENHPGVSVKGQVDLQQAEVSADDIRLGLGQGRETLVYSMPSDLKIRVQRSTPTSENRFISSVETDEAFQTPRRPDQGNAVPLRSLNWQLESAIKSTETFTQPLVEKTDSSKKSSKQKKLVESKGIDKGIGLNKGPVKSIQATYTTSIPGQDTFADTGKAPNGRNATEFGEIALESNELPRGKGSEENIPDSNARNINLPGAGEINGTQITPSRRDYLRLFRMIRHVAHRFQTMQNSEQVQSTFRLTAAGLGKLDIRIFEDESGMSMHIRVENEGLKNQLERNIAALEEMLAEVEISLGSLALDVGEDGAQQKENVPLRNIRRNLNDEEEEVAEEKLVRYLGTNTIEIYA